MMVSCFPRPFFHLYLSHFHVYLLCSCVTSKPHSHTTFHPLTSSSYLLLLSFYSVFLIAGLCPGLFLGVSALIKRPSARISLQPEPTCIFQLLNSDCRQVVTFSLYLYLLNCSTQTADCRLQFVCTFELLCTSQFQQVMGPGLFSYIQYIQ